MKPILINGDESCYCGKRDWVRIPGRICTRIECYECHYLLGIIPGTD